MSSSSNTPPDGYFNDLSVPTGNTARNKRPRSPANNANGAVETVNGGETNVPKLKRIACIICRKRKLKCDGIKPSCSTCTRLGHSCAYDEVRRKSGPKRGYVKALEERLKQVETLLKTQELPLPTPEASSTIYVRSVNVGSGALGVVPENDFGLSGAGMGIGMNNDSWGFNGESSQIGLDAMAFSADMNMDMNLDDNTFTWEMIGLGLEEPLPPQDTIDELHQIYFDKIHPSLPMIHKYRYLAAMNLAPNQRPPVALRYAMWTLAASVSDKFMDLKEHFYHRSRKYMELDYLKGHGENMISIAHAQTHVLLASYEFKMMYFPRAWISTGSAIRLCQMMGLHRLDGAGLDVKQCLPPPRDWTEREERRRTFWMAFCEDRYASIGTGWPMSVDERDILTDLPASDEAFVMSKPETTQSLHNAVSPTGASKLSAFAGVVLMACLFGRNLIHLHRPDSDDRDHDLNGEFWKRHRSMDNILLNTSLSMPSHLKLPSGLGNPNIVFTNMNIHTSTICLHQAAIYKADKNHLPATISAESKVRCVSAANEVAGIMRLISHLDLSAMNPFISFCLYVAARVYVQYLKSRPEDSQTWDSLRFLLSAMNALKKKNPLTESFLVQLDVDLEGLGMQNPKYQSVFSHGSENVGISSSTSVPKIIPPQSDGVAKGCAVQCNFLRLSNEMSVVDGPSPTRGNQQSEPVSATRTDIFNRSSNWTDAPAVGDDDVQRTLTGLTIGNLTTNPYPPDQDGSGTGGYMNSETSQSMDTGHSPSTAQSSSNRPTPNSATDSEPRHNHQPGQQSTRSGSSYEMSPPDTGSRVTNVSDLRAMSSLFRGEPDDTNISATGMAPDNSSGAFAMPEMPGRGFDVPPGWEMSAQASGLTPVGEGVFRQLMGLSRMDSMDIGWEGGS